MKFFLKDLSVLPQENYFFLQPFLGWGKDFSNEEIEICEYINKNEKNSPAFKAFEKIQKHMLNAAKSKNLLPAN